jgi:hypothetical protein
VKKSDIEINGSMWKCPKCGLIHIVTTTGSGRSYCKCGFQVFLKTVYKKVVSQQLTIISVSEFVKKVKKE